MNKLVKLSGIFASITLAVLIFVIFLQQEHSKELDLELMYFIKIGLTLNYAFWSLFFIVGIIMGMYGIYQEINNLKNKK